MISLPKFKKSESEVSGSVDAWLYLLNHAGDGKELPHFGNEILEEALERIRVDNADDELLTKQERDMVTREEIDTIIASGIRRGTEKACAEACAKASADGRAEGRAEGLAKGLAEGLAEGRAEGIDILESLGVPANLIEKARKIVAEKAKESPGKP
jgi:flagellar biosynthesis/type III secretory pathway protein FliH